MKKQLDVIIIGTGTAAFSAASEVKKFTDSFIIISNGIYGTTCVRAGCMPSKAFIHGAQAYHARKCMAEWGIGNVEKLTIDIPALLAHVRSLRDHFLAFTLKTTEQYRPHIIEGDAWFLSHAEIRVGKDIYTAKNIILATGSSPIVPDDCAGYAKHILTTDTLFDQENLPAAMGVMGLSVLGAEMAQAFAQLGIHVTAQHESELIGGLTDPEVSAYAVNYLSHEMDIRLHQTKCMQADTLFVAQSRKANLEHMGLEECGIIKAGECISNYDPETMQVGDLPFFIAGDVKSGRSILNEAVHEGKIAGYNATHEKIKRFRRRTPLQIVHTDPVIAVAGKSWEELSSKKVIVGKATYKDQGCAKIMGKANGILHIYADKENHTLLGAEMFAPAGEHLAHQLAWLIARQITVEEALELPFYHPSLEEGIKTALNNAYRFAL
jgi:dihydrolipoamide dehydrogenase